MENNKVSYIDDSVNSMIADKIEEKLGNISFTTGKKHTFLGMDIKFIARKKSQCTYHITLKRLYKT